MALSQQRLDHIQAHFRAANYLGAAHLYLKRERPACASRYRRPISRRDCSGTGARSPGSTLIYVHLNRLIQDTGSSVLLVVGPGHGAPAILRRSVPRGHSVRALPTLQPGPRRPHQSGPRFSHGPADCPAI